VKQQLDCDHHYFSNHFAGHAPSSASRESRLHFTEPRVGFPQPGAYRLNDPWIVCRAFLLSFGDHVNSFDRLGYEELRATQRVETHTCLPPFSLTDHFPAPPLAPGPAIDVMVFVLRQIPL